MRPRKLCALLAAAAGALTLPAAGPAVAEPGDAGFFDGALPVTTPPSTTTVAPGVTLTTLGLGAVDADDVWTVAVYLPVEPDGPLDTASTGLGPRATADRVASTGALAGINAQWFYNAGVPGSGHPPAGLVVKDGQLLGSATDGRGGVRITRDGRRLDVDAYSAEVTVRAGSHTQVVDGVNRFPGVIWNCGGIGGDLPTEEGSTTCAAPTTASSCSSRRSGGGPRRGRASRSSWTPRTRSSTSARPAARRCPRAAPPSRPPATSPTGCSSTPPWAVRSSSPSASPTVRAARCPSPGTRRSSR